MGWKGCGDPVFLVQLMFMVPTTQVQSREYCCSIEKNNNLSIVGVACPSLAIAWLAQRMSTHILISCGLRGLGTTIDNTHGVGPSAGLMMSFCGSWPSSAFICLWRGKGMWWCGCATGVTKLSMWRWTVMFLSSPTPWKSCGYWITLSSTVDVPGDSYAVYEMYATLKMVTASQERWWSAGGQGPPQWKQEDACAVFGPYQMYLDTSRYLSLRVLSPLMLGALIFVVHCPTLPTSIFNDPKLRVVCLCNLPWLSKVARVTSFWIANCRWGEELLAKMI